MRWKGLTHLVLIYFYFFIPRFTRLKFYSNRNFPSFPFVFLRVNEKLFIMLRFLSRNKRMKETTVSWESFLPQLTFITRVMKKYIVEKLFLIFLYLFFQSDFHLIFSAFLPIHSLYLNSKEKLLNHLERWKDISLLAVIFSRSRFMFRQRGPLKKVN